MQSLLATGRTEPEQPHETLTLCRGGGHSCRSQPDIPTSGVKIHVYEGKCQYLWVSGSVLI